MWKYLRFGYIHWIWMSAMVAALLAGGAWMWFGFAFAFIVGVGGEILTRNWRDETNPEYSYPIIHDLIAYSCVVGYYITTFVTLWACSGVDWFGFGVWVNEALLSAGSSHDVLLARAGNTWSDYLGAGLSLGTLLGISSISLGHELTHRTANPLDMWFGRWCYALSFGGSFAIEHVYGHHNRLGYPDEDPVSPKRGVGFYEFLTVGTWRQWKSGFMLEKARLEKQGRHWISVQNRVFHTWARGLLIAGFVIFLGGATGFLVWLCAIAFSKYILEGLNFFSHYGLFRLPGEKITLRNTFSSCNPISNHFTFNLGRHGDHHVHNQPYYLFRWNPMPECPYGYLTMTLICWIPPLFWKIMIPLVKSWDRDWANDEERKLAARYDRESGMPAFVDAVPGTPGSGAQIHA